MFKLCASKKSSKTVSLKLLFFHCEKTCMSIQGRSQTFRHSQTFIQGVSYCACTIIHFELCREVMSNKSVVEFAQLRAIMQTAENKTSHETFVFLRKIRHILHPLVVTYITYGYVRAHTRTSIWKKKGGFPSNVRNH